MYTRNTTRVCTYFMKSQLPQNSVHRMLFMNSSYASLSYRYLHSSQRLCGYSKGEQDKEYTATESEAEGIMTTDNSRPPPVTNKNVSESGTEPAAAGTESGSTFSEIRDFARNTTQQVKGALKGESRTQSQTSTLETEQKRRPMSTSSKIKDEANRAKEHGKQALKDAKNAAYSAGTAARDGIEEEVDRSQAKGYAYEGKQEAEEVLNSTKNAAKNMYSSAKAGVAESAEEIRSKANEFASSVENKASEAVESLRSSAGISTSAPKAMREPRTDNPTDDSNLNKPRSEL